MPAKQKLTPRQRKLERIMRSIATFAITECYTGGQEAQNALASAIGLIDKAQKKLTES